MVWWASLLLTVGLFILGIVGTSFTNVNIMVFIVLSTALWIAIDSTKINLRRYKSGLPANPVVLCIAVMMFWIVGFPWYLIVRGKILTGTAILKDKVR